MRIVAITIICLLLQVKFCSCFRDWKLKQTSTLRKFPSSLYLIGHLGSDELQRPEDENSPEFQQYLQKLIEMQSLRAKAGFASPSSASSDAYMAKLNRIKLEKRARQAAGLSPDDVDTSYKPVDYKNAMYEMQEPMIRSGGIEGETTSSGSKVRKLTPQEILAYQAAEEAVQEELIRRSKKEIKVIKSTDELQINSDEKLKNAQKNTIIGKELVSDKLSEPLSSQNTATATPDIRVSNEANVNTKKKRKLEANEFEIIGKALESIVKHRGGGPFGSGRASPIDELERNLLQSIDILRKDSMLTSSPTFDEKTITDSSKVDSYKSTVCPIGSFDAPTSVDMSSLIKKAIMLDSGESSYPEKIPVTITEVSEEIPLHEGIQQFLQNPKLMLTQNLHALRDATIEALSLIINEISVRSNAPQSVGERRPAIINNEFLKRHYSHDESTSKRQKKDIQLALALLLKHKGGSGLGHGRLKGKDLDMLEEKLRKSVEYMRS